MKSSDYIKFLAILLVIVVAVALSGCDNWAARRAGGTMTVNLTECTKLVNVTWKGEGGNDSLWYLTRPMKKGESAETLTFQEKSMMGVLEGTVVINEKVGDACK